MKISFYIQNTRWGFASSRNPLTRLKLESRYSNKSYSIKCAWLPLFGSPVQQLSLGFPPEFRVTVYVWKWSGNFFHFNYGKGSGKTGIPERFPERFFFRKTEISGTLFRNYGSFRKFSGKSFRKFPVSRTIGTMITLKSYICKYNTS